MMEPIVGWTLHYTEYREMFRNGQIISTVQNDAFGIVSYLLVRRAYVSDICIPPYRRGVYRYAPTTSLPLL